MNSLVEKNLTEPLENMKPVFSISHLSEMKKRPEYYRGSIYSALHGPVANKSQLNFIYDVNQRKHYENPRVLAQWKRNPSLFLYHGKRYCAEKQNEDNNGASLFDAVNNASNKLYDHQTQSLKLFDDVLGVIRKLRSGMKTEGMGQYPTKILRVK